MSAPPVLIAALLKGLRNETEETEDTVRCPHSLPSPYTLLLTHYTGPEKQSRCVAVSGGGFHDTLALL